MERSKRDAVIVEAVRTPIGKRGKTLSQVRADDLAARLQAVAEPNQVVVASATHQLLGSSFEYEDLGMHELKGIAQAVRAWRAVREHDTHSRYEARRIGGRSPLLGRQEELGLLLRSWEASKERHGQAVLIQGEAGIIVPPEGYLHRMSEICAESGALLMLALTMVLLISDLLSRAEPGCLHALAGRDLRGALLHLRVPEVTAPMDA